MLENIIFTLQIWGAPKLLKVFGKKYVTENRLRFACFECSPFHVKSQDGKVQWIKHWRMCRLRGIARSCGNYFLSRREITSQSMQSKGCIFRHWMWFFPPGQTALAASEDDGIGPVPTTAGDRRMQGEGLQPAWVGGKHARDNHQRWGNMLRFPFVADRVLWLALKARSCLGWSLSTALTRVGNSYYMCYIRNGRNHRGVLLRRTSG